MFARACVLCLLPLVNAYQLRPSALPVLRASKVAQQPHVPAKRETEDCGRVCALRMQEEYGEPKAAVILGAAVIGGLLGFQLSGDTNEAVAAAFVLAVTASVAGEVPGLLAPPPPPPPPPPPAFDSTQASSVFLTASLLGVLLNYPLDEADTVLVSV